MIYGYIAFIILGFYIGYQARSIQLCNNSNHSSNSIRKPIKMPVPDNNDDFDIIFCVILFIDENTQMINQLTAENRTDLKLYNEELTQQLLLLDRIQKESLKSCRKALIKIIQQLLDQIDQKLIF